MKKLLILVPTLQFGGQERVAVNTAKILKSEYEIMIVIFDSRNSAYTPECNVISLNIPATNCCFCRCINVIKRSWKIWKIKRKYKIDFTISFGLSANLVNVLSKGKDDCFIGIRAYDDVSNTLINNFMYKRCDKIIGCSNVICDKIKKFSIDYTEKCVLLYNPYFFDTMIDDGKKEITDYIFSKHTVISHGRLDEVKNYPRLIKAFYLVKKEVPDARLLIIGEGSQRLILERLIKKFELSECVTLIGFRANPFAYLAKASVYVLSSYSEGFPNSLIEGMTFLPVIAVDCKSGPREILSKGSFEKICDDIEETDYGILVAPASKREFSDKLLREDGILAKGILMFLADSQKSSFFRGKARERVKTFSNDKYKHKMLEILEK